MAILTMPSLTKFTAAKFGPVTNTLAHTSRLNKTTQTVELSGNRWVLEATIREDEAIGEAWSAFLAECDGPAGRFHAGDPRRMTPRGAVGASAPLVKGGPQTGKSLITDGWDLSVTGIMLKGDMFAFDLPTTGRSLHKMIADANSDALGNVTLNFRPVIRESPADNAAVIIQNPTCVMRLIDDNQAPQPETPGGIYDITFAAIESYNTG